jgi:hypothetical protein
MWEGHAADAWRALTRDAFVRRRGRLRVLDGPAGRDAPLWPLVHVLWAAADIHLLGEDVPIDALSALLERFAQGEAYTATPRERLRYFDDNAWLGLASLRVAESTRDPAWSDLARRLAAFLVEGEHPEGGIRWREGSESRNTCSTASAAWLNAVTEGRSGVERAGRWLDWLDRTLRRPDGLFADRIEHGTIEPEAWAYNQGAVVAARAGIGRADDGLIDGVAAHWGADRLWREPPAFLVIAARALLADPALRERGIDWLDPHLYRLVEDARDPASGWYVRGDLGSYDGRRTIDQAAIVQLFAMRAGTGAAG